MPADALVCMDFHLDWVYVALVMANDPGREWYGAPLGRDGHGVNINANQEDIDLLVAFDEEETTHLILVEAKGVTSWTNSQLRSKAARLDLIFEPASAPCDGAGRGWPGVRPHFVMTSPRRKPCGVTTESSPSWMTGADGELVWMPLPIADDLVQVERYDEVGGRASKTGMCWRVRPKGSRPSGQAET